MYPTKPSVPCTCPGGLIPAETNFLTKNSAAENPNCQHDCNGYKIYYCKVGT